MASSVVTKTRRESLCKITSGAVANIPKVTHIALGDAGVDSSGNPLNPSETQTALNHEVARYPAVAAYPVSTTARYTITIPQGAHTGIKFSEAALVNSSGGLDAIKNFYPKQKDDDVSFTFTFDDEF